MSSSVCKPLKRAKSTVGVPLTSETLLPLLSEAVALWMGTLKETTLATGASVPMTNEGPVSADVVVRGVEFVLLQPATISAVAIRATSVAGNNLFCVLKSISVTSFSVLVLEGVLERFSSSRGVSRVAKGGFFLGKKPLNSLAFPSQQLENRYYAQNLASLRLTARQAAEAANRRLE